GRRRRTGRPGRGRSACGSGGHGQAGLFPFGESVFEAAGLVTTAAEQSNGVVGVDAVRAAAVGDHLDVLGQRTKVLVELVDRHRTGAGDVTGGELGRG